MKSKTFFLKNAKKYIGTSGRPNVATKWYAKRHGSAYLKAAWCDMFVSYVASASGLGSVIGEFAYCPSHINWFKARGQWGHSPKVGAIVFYDWDGDGVADHVGIVESYKGKKIVAIEGNKGDEVQRVERSSGMIGYGYPKYPGDTVPKTWTVAKGDSLSKIAFAVYGDYAQWKKIYNANKKLIGKNPALIKPRQKLTIPA